MQNALWILIMHSTPELQKDSRLDKVFGAKINNILEATVKFKIKAIKPLSRLLNHFL